ncbi:MAG: dephospho-CoA kinase [Luteimonas sp.]
MAVYRVGLTGGVASGKSAVARCFELLGIPIVDADIAARDVVAVGSDGLAEIVAMFGDGALNADGELDRNAMRRRVFEDDSARHRLEAIVHPRVRSALLAASGTAPAPYVIVIIPLLAEGGGREGYPWLNRILVVDVALELQMARLLQRDAVDDVLAMRMISAQARRHERLAIADDVVVNDGELDALMSHVVALDRQYRALASLTNP